MKISGAQYIAERRQTRGEVTNQEVRAILVTVVAFIAAIGLFMTFCKVPEPTQEQEAHLFAQRSMVLEQTGQKDYYQFLVERDKGGQQ